MSSTSPPGSVAEVVTAAHAAQRSWASFGVAERLGPVERFRRLLIQQADALTGAIGADVGKSPLDVLAAELLPTADACRFLVRRAGRILRPRRLPRAERPLWLFGQADAVHRRPRGVVAVVGTWNYPLILNAVQILQALTAGNAVVWKPSEVTPRFASLLETLLHQAGYPPALAAVLPATRAMGPALAEAAVDHVVFTGSAAVGRKLAARLGERLVSSTLELSGCDAQFVLDDADVALAARAAWYGCTTNRGQTCIAVRRCFVQRPRYADFCDHLRDLSADAAPVPLVNPAEADHARRLVADAVAQGARLLHDGEPGAGGSCRPLVVCDARPEMALCREASFAPVAAVLPFDTLEEALAQEAACPYALGASVFTRSPAKAADLAARLRAGSVTVNDVIAATGHPSLPFGGRQDSGWGVTRGAEGLLEMTVPQTLSARGGSFRPHYDAVDPSRQGALAEQLQALLQATHAPHFGQRLAGWWRLVRAAMK
jgi:acyl-CoA reductase-like NAD-dependent aldehyde dehydrogenase